MADDVVIQPQNLVIPMPKMAITSKPLKEGE